LPSRAGEHLGAEATLPYLSPELRGQKLLVGANFASAGVGILNDTGIQFVDILRMSQQLRYFGEYQGKLRALVGAARARQLVRRSLTLITLGGNDFVNNYYLVPFSLRSRQFSLPDYVRYLVSEYKKILIVRTLFICCSSCVSIYIYIYKRINIVYTYILNIYINTMHAHACRGCTRWVAAACW
jgi:hypothetical protein